MAKVERDAGTTAPRPCSAGAAFDEALAAALAHAEETGATFVHAFEDERVIAGQGTIGLELAEQVPRGGDVRDPDRRRRARGRDRDSRCGRCGRTCASSACRPGPTGADDRRRDRGQAAGRADDADPRRAARRHGRRSTTTRSPRRSCCCSSARSSSSRAPARSAVAALLDRARPAATGRRCALLSGGNIDPTHADLGHAARAHARRPVPRRAHAASPTGRASCSSCSSSSPQERGNVVSVEHHREGMDVPSARREIELTLVMRDEDHCSDLLATLAAAATRSSG